MITRRHLRLDTAIRYSWKNILYSFICASVAWFTHVELGWAELAVPTSVVAILGTALAIILGFRNSSAYDRWWEARKIWGGIVNESRSFMRMVLTIVDPGDYPAGLDKTSKELVRGQVAWVHALRLQLRNQNDPETWKNEIAPHMVDSEFEHIMKYSNKVTQIGMVQGRKMKILQTTDEMDIFSYLQMDDTITRLVDLQGRAERIKSTPLPRPYDYYTMAFLSLFIVFFPFAFVEHFIEMALGWMVIPVTIFVGWIFYQIYVLGKVLSDPFENWKTDVALTAIANVIEIDLKETIGDEAPPKMQPTDGSLM